MDKLLCFNQYNESSQLLQSDMFSLDDSNSTVYLFDQVPVNNKSQGSGPIVVSSQLVGVVTLDESRFGLVSHK